MTPAINDAADLPFQVEILDRSGNIERIIARASTSLIARGAFKAAVDREGDRSAVRVRHGARVVEIHEPRPAASS